MIIAEGANGPTAPEADLLTRIMKRSFKEVLNISQRGKVDMRTATLMLGIGRMAEAPKLRSIYP